MNKFYLILFYLFISLNYSDSFFIVCWFYSILQYCFLVLQYCTILLFGFTVLHNIGVRKMNLISKLVCFPTYVKLVSKS